MKQKNFILGIFGLMIAFGMIFAGCSSKDKDDSSAEPGVENVKNGSLVGTTWENTKSSSSLLRFTSNTEGVAKNYNFIYTYDKKTRQGKMVPDNSAYTSGTFEIDENYSTLIATYSNGKSDAYVRKIE